jgi:ATP-dependent DNA ligase
VTNQAMELLSGLLIEKKRLQAAATPWPRATVQSTYWPAARVHELSGTTLQGHAGPRVRAKRLTWSCSPCTSPRARNAFRHRLQKGRRLNPRSPNSDSPQLAKLVDRPLAQPGWAHEIKFDGPP